MRCCGSGAEFAHAQKAGEGKTVCEPNEMAIGKIGRFFMAVTSMGGAWHPINKEAVGFGFSAQSSKS